jgi:hypothetical protein
LKENSTKVRLPLLFLLLGNSGMSGCSIANFCGRNGCLLFSP